MDMGEVRKFEGQAPYLELSKQIAWAQAAAIALTGLPRFFLEIPRCPGKASSSKTICKIVAPAELKPGDYFVVGVDPAADGGDYTAVYQQEWDVWSYGDERAPAPRAQIRPALLQLADAIDWQPVEKSAVTAFVQYTDALYHGTTILPGGIYQHTVCALGKACIVRGASPERLASSHLDVPTQMFPNVPASIMREVVNWNDKLKWSFHQIAQQLRRRADDYA